MVGLADRIAYVTHDPEDAMSIELPGETPADTTILGATPAEWRIALSPMRSPRHTVPGPCLSRWRPQRP